jgi:uncharacterized protein (DUF1697 family)
MSELKAMGEKLGFAQVRTYIASGNLVFKSKEGENKVRAKLEGTLAAYAGKAVGVLIREAGELADVLARNPFPGQPGNRVMVLFAYEPLGPASLTNVRGRQGEELRLGRREIYIFYPEGMAATRLRVPAGDKGTIRNMNTVAKLVEMARE